MPEHVVAQIQTVFFFPTEMRINNHNLDPCVFFCFFDIHIRATLTCPPGVTAAVAARWVATVCMAAVAALAALQAICSILKVIESRCQNNTQNITRMVLYIFFKKKGFTGQGSSQCSPLHPGEHVQIPSTGSQAAPLAHKQV